MALDALESDNQMMVDWLEHGKDFINLYITDIDTNWEQVWNDNKESNELVTSPPVGL